MDPSFLRRQILSQRAMAGGPTLTSGQSFYTLESLEGASSLPPLKPVPPASLPRRESLPLPLEHDPRLDAQTRGLFADKEVLDARARLLAAEREALLRRLPGGPTALKDQRIYTDGLQASDARARASLDGFQNVDVRGRTLLDNGRVISHGPGVPSLLDSRGLVHGLDLHARDPVQLGALNVPRATPVVSGIAPGATGPFSELLRAREIGVGGSFLPSADPALAWRNIAGRQGPNVGAQNAHLLANGSRELPATRSGPAEVNKAKFQVERNKGLPSSKSLTAKSSVAKANIPPEQSEGWCGVCKIDCHNVKTLGIHVNGRRHKALVEQQQGNTAKVEQSSKTADKQDVNSTPSTSQAGKKRASDEKQEGQQSAKRLKASTAVAMSDAPRVDSQKTKSAATDVVSNPSEHFCKICNISTTGKANLESHLKGKRHAARVKELANPQLAVSAT